MLRLIMVVDAFLQGGRHPEDAFSSGAHWHPQQRQPDAGLHLAPSSGQELPLSIYLCVRTFENEVAVVASFMS